MNVSYGDAYVHECIQMYTHMNIHSMRIYINVYPYEYICIYIVMIMYIQVCIKICMYMTV